LLISVRQSLYSVSKNAMPKPRPKTAAGGQLSPRGSTNTQANRCRRWAQVLASTKPCAMRPEHMCGRPETTGGAQSQQSDLGLMWVNLKVPPDL
jgi:hypothetical protein